MVVTIEGKLQSYRHTVTAFSSWLQYVEGGWGSDRQEISKSSTKSPPPHESKNYKVKVEYYISQICVSLTLCVFMSCQNFHKNVKFSWNMCLCFLTVPKLYIPVKHELACCCHFKYLQWEIKRKKDFSYHFKMLLSSSWGVSCASGVM